MPEFKNSFGQAGSLPLRSLLCTYKSGINEDYIQILRFYLLDLNMWIDPSLVSWLIFVWVEERMSGLCCSVFKAAAGMLIGQNK